jgi:hypothetical protein
MTPHLATPVQSMGLVEIGLVLEREDRALDNS